MPKSPRKDPSFCFHFLCPTNCLSSSCGKGNMKSIFGFLTVFCFFSMLFWGFARIENSTDGAFSELGVDAGPRLPCEVGAGPWRPEGGLIDGQGCYAGGEEGNDQGSGCGYLQKPNEKFGFLTPYYIFFPNTREGPSVGGQLIFDWRVNNVYILPLLLVWTLLFFFLALLSHFSPPSFQRWLRKPFLSSRCPISRDSYLNAPFSWLWELTNGSAFMHLWVFLEMFLTASYCYEHAALNNLVGKISRGFAGVAVGGLPLLILPALRHNPLLVSTFSLPFDRAIAFHRRLALLIFVCATIHLFTMGLSHAFVYNRGQPPADYDWCDENATHVFVDQKEWGEALQLGFKRLILWDIGFPHGPPLAGLISYLAMGVMVFTAFLLRRDKWEIFLICHMMYVIVYVFVWIHYPTTMILSLPAILLLLFDLVVRRMRMLEPRRAILTHFNDAQVTEVRILVENKPTSFGWRLPQWRPWAGSWVTVHIPVVEDGLGRATRLQHHPFSVSSCTELQGGDFELTLHCKDMGEGCWTNHLLDAARESAGGVDVYVDGPFGSLSPSLSTPDRIFLVGGGIGVTPLMFILDSCRDTFTPGIEVTLVWSIRSVKMIDPFLEILGKLIEDSPRFPCQINVLIYVTRGSKPSSASSENGAKERTIEKEMKEISESSGLLAEGTIQSGIVGVRKNPTTTIEELDDYSSEHLKIKTEFGKRPSLPALLPTDKGHDNVCVYVCGPTPLVESSREISIERGFEFHSETFLF